jgi:hypothetical protein
MKRGKIILIVASILLAFGIWGAATIHYEKKVYYEDVDTALKEKASRGYLEQKILDAIKEDRIDDAVMYQHLAEYLHVKLSDKTLAEIEKHNDLMSQSWRNAKSFASGFISGEADDLAGLSGSIASDMTLVGDIRDLSNEGSKFVSGEPYDKLIFGMAVIGVGLSASQFFTLGGTTAAKVGSSIVKVAKKTGKLTKKFTSIVSSKLAKAIDFKKLEKIDFHSMDSITNAKKIIAGSLDIKFIRKSFDKIDTIKKNTSTLDTISLLKYVDDPKDLQKVANVSKKYKKNTKAVFKVLGEGVIKGIVKGTEKVVKMTSILITQIISLVTSVVFFLFALLGKLFSWRIFRVVFSV